MSPVRSTCVPPQNSRELPIVEQPIGVPSDYAEHAKLMMDLLALAYQTDLTRVITFMVGREFGGRTYQEIGIPEGYHALTHHQYNAEKIAKVIQIQTYHAKHLAYYLEKLRSTPDGDGSLLDHSLLLWGAGMGSGDIHSPHDMPIVVAGGGGGGANNGSAVTGGSGGSGTENCPSGGGGGSGSSGNGISGGGSGGAGGSYGGGGGEGPYPEAPGHIRGWDAKTGKRIWHFQIAHHGLWDYDPPTAPVTATVTVAGKRLCHNR